MTENEPERGGDHPGLGFTHPWPWGTQCSSSPPSGFVLPGLGISISLASAVLFLLVLALSIHLLLQIGKRTTSPVG